MNRSARWDGECHALASVNSGLAGPAPKVRAVVLLEPVPIRILDLLEQGPIPPVHSLVQQGQFTAA